jgi:quercetin dioxygenase-like cupin family protein
MAIREPLSNGLPPVNRLITGHNKEGKAVFSDSQSDALEWQSIGNIAKFALGYTTSQFPVDLNGSQDLQSYDAYLVNKPGITIPGGTVLRFVDMAPGTLSPMHRTVSLDYGVVLEGEVDLVLDSGERKTMQRGDVAIQRGTNHAWQNNSKTTWARMMYVLQESQPIQLQGSTLGEDYGTMPDVVRKSS